MKHAVLGAGGVGALIGTLLAAEGESVTFIVRTAAAPGRETSTVVRADGSTVKAEVAIAGRLLAEDAVDILWIATKATQLNEALRRVQESSPRAVVPLLNGFEHVRVLEERFGHERVFPGTIAVEAERTQPGIIRQNSAFVRVRLPQRGAGVLSHAADVLARRNVEVAFESHEATLLWSKLVFLAPAALTTSASSKSLGFVREDAQWRTLFQDAAEEVAAVGRANGATLSAESAMTFLDAVNPDMRSSMQKDIEQGKEPEIDAIGEAVVRSAQQHGIDVPVLRSLIDRVRSAMTL